MPRGRAGGEEASTAVPDVEMLLALLEHDVSERFGSNVGFVWANCDLANAEEEAMENERGLVRGMSSVHSTETDRQKNREMKGRESGEEGEIR